MRANLVQVLRFGVVGILATAVHFAVLRAGVELLGAPPAPMNGLAFCVAFFVSYLGQSRWVFGGGSAGAARLARFAASAVGGLLGNVGIMALAVNVLGLPYEWGFALALVLIPALTFFVNKLWVFSSSGS